MAALYFVLAFAITWGLQLPAVFSSHPEKYMPLVGLGAFGPMFAAMIASKVEGTGVGALMRPFKLWRVSPIWYLAALALSGALYAVGALVYNLFGHAEPLVFPPNRPEYVVAALVFPFGEEIGWRGFALPRLRDRFGPLAASVIIGVFWMLWHIPMLTLQHVSPMMYVVFLPYMIGGSVMFTWIYERTGGSLLLAFLTHVGVHLSNPGRAMPGNDTPMIIHMVGYIALAIILVIADHRIWRAPRPSTLGGQP